MTDQIELWIEGFITSIMFYPLLAGFIVIDAVFPLAPSESLITLAGAWSGSRGVPNIYGVIGVSVIAAVIGDNLCYFFGRRLEKAIRRFPADSRAARAIEWATRNIEKRHMPTIIIARFLPWARFILTILLGSHRFPWFRFFIIDTFGVILWATQAALIGYIGGWLFKDFPLIGMAVGLVIAAVVGSLIEWLQRRKEHHDPEVDAAVQADMDAAAAAEKDTAKKDTAEKDNQSNTQRDNQREE